MKNTYFNNFMEVLKNDRKSAECMGYAFLDLTPRQICKVIDYYYEIGETTVEYRNYKMVVNFGGMWNYPVENYEVYGKYDLLNPSLV